MLQIETALSQIDTILLQIETALPKNNMSENGSQFAAGLDFQWFRFLAGRSQFLAGRKIIKVALSAALEPTASWDLEARSMLCLKRNFPKWPAARHFKS